MTTTTPDLAPQTAELARLVAAVREDQLRDPTPCPQYPVAALLDHVHGVAVGFRLSAEKRAEADPPSPSADALPAGWQAEIPAELDAMVAAWRQPAAWEGVTRAGGVELPAAVMGLVALNEVLVHGWDLAAATGQRHAADPAAVQACLAHAVWFAEAVPEGRDAIYGPVVPVPDDATALDRLLGLTGRDPAWSPSA